MHLMTIEIFTAKPLAKAVEQGSCPYLDVAKIDQWLSAKAARGVYEFPPNLELASALELCNTISNEELSFQRVCYSKHSDW